ncbi:MAG: glycoside hydrolase family 3 C-terminal domain-containing protein [Clostridia bacterium]|nr:glycoside hydrolase family 3 C-terminal domain-containing protein [Clostridia bacterium]
MIKQNHLIKTPFDPSPYADRVEALMSQMTLSEKVGQLNLECADEFEGLTEWNLGDPAEEGSVIDKIRRGSVGAVLCRRLAKNTKFQEIAVKESRLGIPLLFGYDVIHGHKTMFPIPLAGASSWDPQLIEKAESCAAKEAYADGINWAFAPMIDLCRDPRWGRVAEGAGEDPLLGSLIAQAKVKGLQCINPDTGKPYIAAGFKHYCAYGLAEGGRDYDEANISDRTLFMEYMKPYSAAVDAGSMNVMSSFNVLNGEPVTASRYFLTDILRDKYGFKGFLVSDFGSIPELIKHRVAENVKDAAALAITAGTDMDMASCAYLDTCEALYMEDKRFADAIEESVRRILSVKFALGLFEHPYNVNCEDFTHSAETVETAREVARNAAVMLENKNGKLPLSKDKKFLLTGYLADSVYDLLGTWSTVHPEIEQYTIKRAMEEGGYNFVYHKGIPVIDDFPTPSEKKAFFDEAAKLAGECDEIIFVCGEPTFWSGECANRVTITMPEVQMEHLRALKKTGKPITSVLMCGRPLACPELSELSDALLLTWHGGSEGGHAALDVLFGDFNPCGRLPITFPYHTGQIPNYHSWLSSGRPRERYKRYRDCRSEPLYPFGYGLSYSTVEYRDISIERDRITEKDMLRVHVKLENTSSRDTYEVVQAYFKDNVSSVATPERKLCGFVKVHVPAGETVDTVIEIPASRFALMTRDLREVVEPGEFTLFVGHDSTCETALAIEII